VECSSVDIDDRKRADEQIIKSAQESERSEFYLTKAQRLGHIGSWYSTSRKDSNTGRMSFFAFTVMTQLKDRQALSNTWRSCILRTESSWLH